MGVLKNVAYPPPKKGNCDKSWKQRTIHEKKSAVKRDRPVLRGVINVVFFFTSMSESFSFFTF